MTDMCFFNAVLMDGEKSFFATINYLLLFFVLIAFALVAVYMGFAKKVASHFDCINVFIFGSFVWLFASVLTYCKFFYFTASGYVFCVVGIGIVYASLVQMRQSVCKAMEILDEISLSQVRARSVWKFLTKCKTNVLQNLSATMIQKHCSGQKWCCLL